MVVLLNKINLKTVAKIAIVFFMLTLVVGCIGKKRGVTDNYFKDEVTTQPVREITSGNSLGAATSVSALQELFENQIGNRVYFGFDRYDLNSASRANLDKQAELLRQNPKAYIRIAGNCDERGTREYNLALGARRAQAVKDYLVASGVSSNRIQTISYGKERPIDPRSNETAWARNRNAETRVVSIGY